MANEQQLSNKLAICGIVFAGVSGVIGVILGLIGLKKYPRHSGGYVMSIIAITYGAWNTLISAFFVTLAITRVTF
ncbi:MAG: hypothetical protein RRY34_06395 [Victivallaceae bacterium]